MKFLIAPDWLMKLSDEDLLTSKQVKDIYGYSLEEATSTLLQRGSIPKPEKENTNIKRKRYYWSVGYIKNYLKLPSELNNKYIKND